MSASPQTNLFRRVYCMDWRKRLLFLLLGAVLTLLWFLPLSDHHNIYDDYGLVGQFIGLLLATIGFNFFQKALSSRLVIDGTRIEVRNFIRLYRATVGEIEGYYEYEGRIYIRLKDNHRNIAIPQAFDLDDDFRAWLKQLPNLNRRNREQRLSDVSTDLTLGVTAQERLRELDDARRIKSYFLLITLASATGLRWGPAVVQAACGCVLFCAPIFVYWLLRSFPQLYAFHASEGDPRADLFWYLWPVGLFIQMATFRRFDFVSIATVLWVAVPATLAYSGAFWRFLPKRFTVAGRICAFSWFLLFFAFPFADGIIELADTLPDRAPIQTFLLPVIPQQIKFDEGKYRIELPPWGPKTKSGNVTVGAETYSRILTSKQVCIDLHPGFLHLAWYEVRP